MSNHLKFCGCRMCRTGRHSKFGKATIRRATRRQRQRAKIALRDGREPARVASVPYTD